MGLLYFLTIFLYDGFASFAIIARNIVSCDITVTEGGRVSLKRWNAFFGAAEFVFVSTGLFLWYQYEVPGIPVMFQVYFLALVVFAS